MTDVPVPSPAGEQTEDAQRTAADQVRRERQCRLQGWILYTLVRALFHTLRLRFENRDGLETGGKGAIFVTWHGRSLIPANVFRNRGYWALISLSRDGEIQ